MKYKAEDVSAEGGEINGKWYVWTVKQGN